MSEQEFKSSVLSMLRNSFTIVEPLIEKAIQSGMIDLSTQDKDNYSTRKALVYVILNEISKSQELITEEGIKEAQRLSKLI